MQKDQGEKVVKYRWQPRNVCNDKSETKNLITCNNSSDFGADF